MSGLTSFYKQNALQVENQKYVASNRFVDEDGKPLEWEIKALSTREDERLREKCTKKENIKGRRGLTQDKLNSNLYMGQLAAECTVFPNLKDAELQDSYGVTGADELLKVMLIGGEYLDYLTKVQEVNGYDRDIDDLSEEIKN